MRRRPSAECPYCGEEDTAEHTVFMCHRWDGIRQRHLINAHKFNANQLVAAMLECRDTWEEFAHVIRTIVSQKLAEERALEN
ncbi:hypothetical protein LSTR_LSTR012255 [Laodelphax striatellus]|uniref:Reverse transcriptase zinc-binding domain-containing protein n=1 Tax=Laodelphax striatellus TaxID=195883 RepID=A0A482WKA5_LAOST|nr:hypothetical protein LSTR_LSTR012255 [Laodelphax striatellus]